MLCTTKYYEAILNLDESGGIKWMERPTADGKEDI
jgi:hypothetical protein